MHLSGNIYVIILQYRMFITLPYKLVHDTKVQAMKVQRDRLFRCKCEVRARRERVSSILLKRESLPGANEVGVHDRDKHYLLSTYYSITL